MMSNTTPLPIAFAHFIRTFATMSAIGISSIFIKKVKDMEKLNVSIIHVFSIGIIYNQKIEIFGSPQVI
jgi:uncharacterized membrane protein